MLTLLLILLLVAVTLAVVLAAGSLFFQSYIYTEVSPGVFWQAPAAAVVMTAFYFSWSWLNIPRTAENVGYVPYHNLFSFSPEVKMTKNNEPVKKFWTIRKGGEKQLYEGKKIPKGAGPPVTLYKLKGTDEPWNAIGVVAIEIEKDGQTYRFEPRSPADNDYPYFVSPEGWRMNQYETGVTGLPRMFSYWLLLVNVFLNLLHLGLWFVCLWLILRFQWSHALGLAFVIWLVTMFAVLPPLFTQAASLAPAV